LATEEITRQFDVIEDKIEKLVKSCQNLEAQNKEYKTRIQDLEQELQSKREAEKVYLDQKELIKGKIDSLLGKLGAVRDSETP
jgi:chromosome segregation ATPase